MLLSLAHPLAGGPYAGWLARLGGDAGADFEPPEFLGGQGGLLVA